MRIYLLRHGKTNFNQIYKSFIKKYQIQPHEEHFCNILNYLPLKHLIDPSINSFGKKKILEHKKKERGRQSKTKYVIISPMRRALETAEIFYGKKKNVKKIVHPGLRANLMSMYDIPIGCYKKMEVFDDFDFSLLENDVVRYGFEWFLYDLGNCYNKRKAIEFLKVFENRVDLKNKACFNDFEGVLENGVNFVNGADFGEIRDNYGNLSNLKDLQNEEGFEIEKAIELVKLMREICPESLELPIDVNHRIFNFKKWLKEFIMKNNVKDEEITLLGHDVLFKYFVAEDFKKDGYPYNCPQIDNSELFEYNFDI